jgi:hypothetical protein
MKKNLFISVCLFSLILSCTNDISDIEKTEFEKSNLLGITSYEEFSDILSSAIENNLEIREFIKNEALKKINNDYDVFYPIIKNVKISNDKSFRDFLKEFDSDNKLEEIEKELPLLTIYIPDLNGFSAEKWNITDVPYIVPNIKKNDSALFYKSGVIDFKAPANYIPQFPILIIKNNERIILNNNKTRSLNDNQSLNSNYIFIDESFNGTLNRSEPQSLTKRGSSGNAIYPQPEDYIYGAYNEAGSDGNLWQRDNIYYGLTRDQEIGALKRNFKENIACLEFSYNAYLRMTDQDDPRLERTSISTTINDPNVPYLEKLLWGEGYYEFKIDIYINNLEGLGTVITRYFSAKPTDLFTFSQSRTYRIGNNITFSVPSEDFIIPKAFYPNITLSNWDLQNNGAAWKFSFTEIDESETITITSSHESTFATNFEYNASFGNDIVKVGYKFGASSQLKKSNTFTTTTTKTSDDLGTLEAYFYDPIILKNSRGVFSWYKIDNGMISMILKPTKVY